MPGLVICTQSFTPKNLTDDINGGSAPGPALFPAGLKPLVGQYGGGLMLYMVNFCPENAYLSPAQAVESFRDPTGSDRYFLAPLPEESEAAYGRLMDEGIKQGMTLFEIDFMERNFDWVPYFRQHAGAAEGWLRGQRETKQQLCRIENVLEGTDQRPQPGGCNTLSV